MSGRTSTTRPTSARSRAPDQPPRPTLAQHARFQALKKVPTL